MKRVLAAALFAAALIPATFAASLETSLEAPIQYVDSFSFMADNEQYVELYEAINNCMSANEVESRYETLKASLATTAQDWMILMKASLNCAHYHLEVAPKKNSKRAKELISYANDIYKALEKANVDERLLMPLHFCLLSLDYLAHPLSIAKGLESVAVIDKAYESYPTELAIANLYAARRLNAPAIGGGDPTEASEIYTAILSCITTSQTDIPEVSKWELFDAYAGIAKCYAKQKDKEKALLYYEKALALYPANEAVLDAIKDISK